MTVERKNSLMENNGAMKNITKVIIAKSTRPVKSKALSSA